MPVAAIVDGVKGLVYYLVHPPAHIHLEYGSTFAQMEIATGRLLNGSLPVPKLRRVLSWLADNRSAVEAAWNHAVEMRKPRPIR